MPKPSFTTQDQVDHLSEKWHVGEDRARQMLLDVRNMLRDALIRKERVYLDDFGTFHGKKKKRTLKLLPFDTEKTIIPSRLNVKFEESEDLITALNPAYTEELAIANAQ